jgi:hypothetical protein
MEGQEHEVNNNVKDKEVEEVVVLVNNSNEKEERRIVVDGPEEWLCVARLPLDMEQEEFRDLLAEFGRVEEAFLVMSTKTGKKQFNT